MPPGDRDDEVMVAGTAVPARRRNPLTRCAPPGCALGPRRFGVGAVSPLDVRCVEDPQPRQCRSILHRFGGRGEDVHLGQMRFDLPPLDRVGVDVDQRVERDVELVGKLLQILRFVAPVDSPGGDVLPTQDHARMLVKDIQDVGLIVLADHDQQNSALLETDQRALERLKAAAGPAGTQSNAIDAILGERASPENAVAIESQHFGGRSAQPADCPRQFDSQFAVDLPRVRCSPSPLPTIANRRHPDALDDPAEVADFHPLDLTQLPGPFASQGFECSSFGTGRDQRRW